MDENDLARLLDEEELRAKPHQTNQTDRALLAGLCLNALIQRTEQPEIDVLTQVAVVWADALLEQLSRS